jgi:Fungal cellulose binding domain
LAPHVHVQVHSKVSALVALVVALTLALLGPAAASVPPPNADCVNHRFDQCGGLNWRGSTCCFSYNDCEIVNTYYSQCRPYQVR